MKNEGQIRELAGEIRKATAVMEMAQQKLSDAESVVQDLKIRRKFLVEDAMADLFGPGWEFGIDYERHARDE